MSFNGINLDMNLKDINKNKLINGNEKLDDLNLNGYKIIQDPNKFCFGMDSVLLCDFCIDKIKTSDLVIDLGCGNGIICILLAAKKNINKIIGLEIQKECVDLAKRNILFNDLKDKIKIIHGDIKKISRFRFLKNKFDIVITNPPYLAYKKSSLINKNKSKAIARHEILCNLEDIILNACYLLKDKGKFFMIHRAQRMTDIFYIMRKYNLEPKKIKLIHKDINSAAQMFLIQGVKNAGCYLKIEKPIIIYDK